MEFILYNPLSGNGSSKKIAESYAEKTDGSKLVDITGIEDFSSFVAGLSTDDAMYIFGGDGTINRFVNAVDCSDIKCDVFYYPSGTGNDFCVDVDKQDVTEPFRINEYITDLPTVTVKGKDYKFINGIGFGIDGYCCEVGDIVKHSGKVPNYTAIAIKGLLFHFKPRVAVVTVDGVSTEFKKVWIAPTMFGRHYGGGMIPTPDQSRESGNVSLMVFHGGGRISTLIVFPSIFKGKHVLKKKRVSVFEGKEITVKFDRPTPLQIDGETVLDVTEYTVKANARKKTTV